MIGLVIASAINLTGLQAAIAAPTSAFRGCLREAAVKAKTEKVTGDGIEAYLRSACSGQMGTLKSALVEFRVKNGMTRKNAASDADMTVDDYIATPADNYRFMADFEKPKAAPATAVAAAPTAPTSSATPAPTPAAASQPPKP
jgi:hypothetical protein